MRFPTGNSPLNANLLSFSLLLPDLPTAKKSGFQWNRRLPQENALSLLCDRETSYPAKGYGVIDSLKLLLLVEEGHCCQVGRG